MAKLLRIGTRDSQLAVWQANLVLNQLKELGISSELVLLKSEGDLDLITPIYEMGVQGVFTRTLDIALINHKVDIAVHSMKDVPTQLPTGIQQAAVLKRGPNKDVLVWSLQSGVGSQWSDAGFKPSFLTPDSRLQTPDSTSTSDSHPESIIIATSSIRRRAQWLHRYPNHQLVNLRGNINTRMRKLEENNWQGAIFAAAGLERIGLRPTNAVDLEWMLPAPAQGAIMVVCRSEDDYSWQACQSLNDADTALCTKMEREFLRALLGGCSTPISALAEIEEDELYFRGNILSPDGKQIAITEKILPRDKADNLGHDAALELIENGGREIISLIQDEGK